MLHDAINTNWTMRLVWVMPVLVSQRVFYPDSGVSPLSGLEYEGMWGICLLTGIYWRSYGISNTNQHWDRRQPLLSKELQLFWDCTLVLDMNLVTWKLEGCFTELTLDAQWKKVAVVGRRCWQQGSVHVRQHISAAALPGLDLQHPKGFDPQTMTGGAHFHSSPKKNYLKALYLLR